MELPEDEARTVQIAVAPNSEGATFEIFSRNSHRGEGWTDHVTGSLRPEISSETECGVEELKEVQVRAATEAAAEALYQRFSDMGVAYGKAFHAVRLLWSGKGEA